MNLNHIFLKVDVYHWLELIRKVMYHQEMTQKIVERLWVAIKGSIGNIATWQPRCYIPLFSHLGCRVAKYNIYYLFFSWLLFI
jgi:hypothetical protein